MRVEAAFGSLGTSPGMFAYPRAMDLDRADGALWVIDKAARVQKLDAATGECVAMFVMPEQDRGKPVGVTVAETDRGKRLFIPDTHYARVMIFDPPERMGEDAVLVGSFGSYGWGPGQFIYPTSVGVLREKDGLRVERLYVAEYGGNDRVSVFDASYEFLFSFGSFGPGGSAADSPVTFQRPQLLAIDESAGEIYVVDSRNHRIGCFSLEGEHRRWFGSPETAGTEPGVFRYPYGLCLLGDGTGMVAEFGNNRVQRIGLQDGRSLGVWGKPGRGVGELATPWAVVAGDKLTYVLDSGNHRVVAMTTPRRRR